MLCLAGPAVQPAAAADGAPPAAAPVLADEALDAALETVSELVPAELVTSAPAEASIEAPAPAAVTEDTAAPAIPPLETVTATEPLLPAPAPVSEAPAAVSAPEEVSEPVSPEPAPQEAPAPAATQAQPLNLNVAVRVDSPGDNGAIEQLNAAIIAVVGAPQASTASQYQAPTPQYQPPQASTAPVAAPASPAPAPAESGWTWTWTCGGSSTDVLGAGGSAALLPENWSWNWNWNCGGTQVPSGNNDSESSGQYHPAVTQYQPVNLNISIRIGSPGNDGPVTQSNVSVVVVTPPVVVPPVVVSPLPIPLPNLPTSSPGTTAPPAASGTTPAAGTQPELFFELAAFELAISSELGGALDWLLQGIAGPFISETTAASDEQDAVAARSYLAPRSRATGRSPRPVLAGLTASSSAQAERAVAVVHAQASVRSDRPAHAKPKRNPSRRPAPPMRAPVLASGFAGATPGGADGGGWPLLALLLVPFSLALVDSSRRMARDAALPAALEFITRRERPG